MYDLNIILNYQIKTTKYKKISTIYYEKFEQFARRKANNLTTKRKQGICQSVIDSPGAQLVNT